MAALADGVRAARPAARACGAALVAGLLLSYVLSVLTPTLLVHHALLLETLSGNVASIVIGGAQVRAGRASAALVLLAPLVGIVLYDLAFFWAGRLWGNQVLGRFVRTPRARRRLEQTEELVARRGVVVLSVAYFLPLPNPATYVLCGASGMRLAAFVVGDALGTLLWTSVLASLGYAIGRPVLDLLDALEHWTLVVTVVLVVVFVAVSRWRAARRQRGRQTAMSEMHPDSRPRADHVPTPASGVRGADQVDAMDPAPGTTTGADGETAAREALRKDLGERAGSTDEEGDGTFEQTAALGATDDPEGGSVQAHGARP